MSDITQKENWMLCYEGKQPQWIPCYLDANAHLTTGIGNRKLDPNTGYYIDPYGVEFVVTTDGATPVPGKVVLEDVTEWKSIMPDSSLLKRIDWEGEAQRINAQVNREEKFISSLSGYVWEEMHYIMGMENALVSIMIEPEASYEFLDAMADLLIESYKMQAKYLKPEFIVLIEHVATDKGMIISPDTYREILKPIHKKLVQAIYDLGIIPCMHCDGYIEDILPDYADIGIKMIQPFQIMNDINRYKEEYGIMAVGGWDSFGRANQADTTEEEARASVRLAMDTYGPGGRYAFWESGVTPSFPNNVQWIADEARIYGKTFYQK